MNNKSLTDYIRLNKTNKPINRGPIKKEPVEQEELQWIYPTSNKTHGNADITITIGKSQSDKSEYRASFVIRNSAHKKLTKTDRVQLAARGDRLYFRGAKANEKGYKLYNSSKNETIKYLCLLSSSLNLDAEVLQGSYKLQFDHQNNLPYIRLDKKL